MNKMKQSQAFLRKRKMLMALPLLVIPFLTMAFWAMGGGQAKVETDAKNSIGLNLHLPDPKVKKESLLDKLGFYDKADKDSLKLKEEMRSDPYYQEQGTDEKKPGSSNELEQIVQHSAGKYYQSSLANENKLNQSPYNTGTSQAEEKLMQKLAELNKAMNQPQSQPVKTEDYREMSNALEPNPKLNSSVERLEGMLQSMNQADDSDTELRQLSSMMDKIMDIQHPERVKSKLKEKSIEENKIVFAVNSKAEDDTIVNGFYGLENETGIKEPNAIEAVVNENQVLVNGAILKLRLLNDMYIKNFKIPAGNFVFGIVSLNGERLEIKISSIRSENSIYPVKMEVYDMDGLPGIYVPGAISRDVAKQSADNSLQTMQFTTLDPSFAAQATAAGIGTLKNLLSKKIKLVKVMVKAGYKVLLKDQSTSPGFP